MERVLIYIEMETPISDRDGDKGGALKTMQKLY